MENTVQSAIGNLQSANCKLQIADCRLWTVDCGLWTVEDRNYYKNLNLLRSYGFLRYFCKICIHQEIFYLWRPVLKDPKDDMLLELAVAGDCDYIVTHNIKHFKGLEQFKPKPKPIKPKEFIGLQGGSL